MCVCLRQVASVTQLDKLDGACKTEHDHVRVTNIEDCTPQVFYVVRAPSSYPRKGFELMSSRIGVRCSNQMAGQLGSWSVSQLASLYKLHFIVLNNLSAYAKIVLLQEKMIEPSKYEIILFEDVRYSRRRIIRALPSKTTLL